MKNSKTKQRKIVEKYFSYFGCSTDMITAIDSEYSVTFIITCSNFTFVNLIPRYTPDDISIFHNNIRIKFNKTIEHGN
jgi:hypothetical protein